MTAGSPRVFAHRGASEKLPEHTLEAYLRALQERADGLECDVRLTRDGHLVCHHDRRLDRTSNGRGLVGARTLEELRRLDFGSWHDGGRPVPVLTLDRLLRVIRAMRQPVHLLVDVKHPGRYGRHLERRLVALLHHHGLVHPTANDRVRVSVMSFSPLALRRLRRLAPAVPTVQLLERPPPDIRITRWPFGAYAAGPSLHLVRARPGLIPALRAAGYPVYVWTVNEPADVDLAVGQGADGVITDRPAQTLARLGR